MIDISGHLRATRREIGFEDNEQPLMVNCCGYQAFMTKDFSRQRPGGRLDYQIIYLYKGCGTYVLDGSPEEFPAGSMILYHPGQPQIYSYLGKDKPEVFWIHFTGYECGKLLEHYQMETGFIGESLYLKTLFQEIILELQLKKPYYEDIIISSFYRLLALICRIRGQEEKDQTEYSFMLDRLVVQLNQRYMEAWTVARMADYCHLSEDYFAHSFKKNMGMAPMRYLEELRIEKAKELLEGEGMNISTIGTLVGYEDSLYFSRVFKKLTGLSPRLYRKSQMDARF